jgi:hypothetical protein
MPDFMQGDAGMGTEGISRDDVLSPRLKLIQGLSPELQDYDELRPGNFFQTIDPYIFKDPIRVVIIIRDTRYILWRPRDSGGGILARCDDGVHWSPSSGEFTVQLDRKDGGGNVTWRLAPTVIQSGLHLWGSSNPQDSSSPPAATKMYNFFLAFPDYPEVMPAVLTMQRSSENEGKKVNGLLLRGNRVPIFGRQWILSSIADTNRAGQDFYNIKMEPDGNLKADEAHLYATYREMHIRMTETGIRIKDEELEEATNTDASGPSY